MTLKDQTSEDKLRGGFYTPLSIALFILHWINKRGYQGDFLEPSCGDGVFLNCLNNSNYPYKSITGIELCPEEAEKASSIKLNNSSVICGDFLEYCLGSSKTYNAIIGNPPFIRYQFLQEKQQNLSNIIFEKAGLKYSKLMNIWGSFVVGSSLLLDNKGIIGMVIPAELLQVGFAKVIRDYLIKTFNKVGFITFEKLVFPEIQQEVLLLFCEKDGSENHLIGHLEVRDEQDLLKFDFDLFETTYQEFDFASNKWTTYFLDKEELDFISEVKSRVKNIRDYAKVEVGITTGSNPFFTVPKSIVDEYDLKQYAKPLVGRSFQVPSAILNHSDWQDNNNAGVRSNILIFPKAEDIKSPKVISYLMHGKEMRIHEGYKCRIREEWQIIPSTWVSDALFIRRNNLFPKLIKNEAGVFTTDTMHRVSIKPEYNIDAIVASYYNTISLAFSELCGRSHGGGVLELMPNEVEDIPLPYNEENKVLLPVIDFMLRSNTSIGEILEITDAFILKRGFHFTDEDIIIARRIWKKMQKRRLERD